MVEWATTGSGVWAAGREESVRIEAPGWEPCGATNALPRSVDATVSGSTRHLRLPGTPAAVGPEGACDLTRTRRLPPGEYLLSLDGSVQTLVRFAGPARVAREGEGVAVRFEDRTEVTVGFRETATAPPTIRVPRTPEGVARALTLAGGAATTTTPARSHPASRDHPPLLTFGDERVPEAVRTATPETGVTLCLPSDYESLFVAAPLAYYTGATVEVGSDRPRLETPDRVHALGETAPLATEAASLLRELFYLDSYAREDAVGGRVAAPAAAPTVDLDAYGSLPMAGRLEAVLDGEFADFRAHLPDWHLSTYLEARPDNARALPYLLDRLSLVYPPDASELDGRSLLRRTLDDFYRGREGEQGGPSGPTGEADFYRAGGDVATANRLDPELRGSHLHAWLAEGIPITAAKTSVRAYENRLRHGERPRERLQVDVVLNDRGMNEERPVADIYRERAANLPVEVTVHEQLNRRELAAVFESDTDFVHYVGHCEVAGLKCADGYLSTAGLDVGARTFFLNACGSYSEGLSLVDGGAVAGGVTLTKVLNEQAATVGTVFARLLINGFGIERALSLARRQILMGQDYAVVGDGTYTLAPADGDPAVVTVAGGPETFEVGYEVVTARSAGRAYREPFDGGQRLQGVESRRTLSRRELVAFLERHDVPVLHDGALTWADEFLDDLE